MKKKSKIFNRIKAQNVINRRDLSYYAIVDSLTFATPQEDFDDEESRRSHQEGKRKLGLNY